MDEHTPGLIKWWRWHQCRQRGRWQKDEDKQNQRKGRKLSPDLTFTLKVLRINTRLTIKLGWSFLCHWYLVWTCFWTRFHLCKIWATGDQMIFYSLQAQKELFDSFGKRTVLYSTYSIILIGPNTFVLLLLTFLNAKTLDIMTSYRSCRDAFSALIVHKMRTSLFCSFFSLFSSYSLSTCLHLSLFPLSLPSPPFSLSLGH